MKHVQAFPNPPLKRGHPVEVTWELWERIGLKPDDGGYSIIEVMEAAHDGGAP